MAQAREHSAVSPALRWTPASPQGWRAGLCAALGLVLLGDAVVLMARGLFSLGVMLPFGLGAGLVVLGLWWPGLQQWLASAPRRRTWWRAAWWICALWLASVALFWVFLARSSKEVPSGADVPHAIVVLGSGTPHGTASPVLAARLDVALEQAARFPDALVLVSGGTDFASEQPEAQIMGDYLRARGLAAGRVLQEEASTSTEENLRLSRAILARHGLSGDATVQIITSDFHTLRARWIAQRAGYTDVSTVGAATPLYVRYNAWLREYFAVLSGYVLSEF